MIPATRPVVFIGSSTGGLPFARALQVNLDHDAEVILWSQGVFGLSEGTLESLVGSTERFDFAILVLTPDDLTLSKDQEVPSPRDNVVFELGLFMGALGRTRTFIVYDRTAAIKLPTDLAGVTPASFAPPSAGSLESALGASSTLILNAIQSQGRRARSPDEEYINQTTQYRVIKGLLEPTAWQFFILMHEAGATMRREEWVMLGIRYEYEITSDIHSGQGHGYFNVNQICNRLADSGLLSVDLRGRVSLSERGHAFAEWLIESGYRAQYFWSDIGTWGERPESFRSTQHPQEAPRNMIEMQQRAQAQDATNQPPSPATKELSPTKGRTRRRS